MGLKKTQSKSGFYQKPKPRLDPLTLKLLKTLKYIYIYIYIVINPSPPTYHFSSRLTQAHSQYSHCRLTLSLTLNLIAHTITWPPSHSLSSTAVQAHCLSSPVQALCTTGSRSHRHPQMSPPVYSPILFKFFFLIIS